MDAIDPLGLFRQVMWVSGIMSLGLVVFSLLLTAWRSRWMRLLDWEEALWRRAGVKPSILRWLRKTEDNRLLIASVILLCALHLALFLGSASAYVYFYPRVKADLARRGTMKTASFEGTDSRVQLRGRIDWRNGATHLPHLEFAATGRLWS